MKILFDTNVYIDILANRKDFVAFSKDAFKKAVSKNCSIYITTTSVTDIMYVLRKYFGDAKVQRTTVGNFISNLKLARVHKKDFDFAFSGVMTDFEDAVQASCAKRYHLDLIVTRNVKDFANSPVKTVTPQEFLSRMAEPRIARPFGD